MRRKAVPMKNSAEAMIAAGREQEDNLTKERNDSGESFGNMTQEGGISDQPHLSCYAYSDCRSVWTMPMQA